MAIGILIIVLLIIGLLSISGRRQVAWMKDMRRVNAGVARKAEWMAPDQIIEQVRQDYLEAIRWLPESMLHSWSQQWAGAPQYLTGRQLKRHQEILKHYRMGKPPRYTGVLRCMHDISVSQFSEDGQRCLVVDHQSSRRMATYDYWTHERANTQDLGDGIAVYEVAYDTQDSRWKIDRFVQELPATWQRGNQTHLRMMTALPPAAGRDN
jgi:hypothetical protein